AIRHDAWQVGESGRGRRLGRRQHRLPERDVHVHAPGQRSRGGNGGDVVKKKLKSLDPRLHYVGVVIALLIFGFVGHMMLISPQGKKALAVQAQIDAQNTQIYQRKAALRTTHAPTIRTADIFNLSPAMPDATDMPV